MAFNIDVDSKSTCMHGTALHGLLLGIAAGVLIHQTIFMADCSLGSPPTRFPLPGSLSTSFFLFILTPYPTSSSFFSAARCWVNLGSATLFHSSTFRDSFKTHRMCSVLTRPVCVLKSLLSAAPRFCSRLREPRSFLQHFRVSTPRRTHSYRSQECIDQYRTHL